MNHFIDYLFQFDRRLVYPIYNIETDFNNSCMNNVSIAVDLGFPSHMAGLTEKIIPCRFRSRKEVEDFPWNLSLSGERTRAELANLRDWIPQSTVPIGGGSFGPLTIASDILGVEPCCRLVATHPDVVHAILERVTDFLILLAREEIAMGVTFIWIAEPVASLFSPKVCREFCVRYLAKLFSSIPVPGLLHVCGKTDRQFRCLLETGAEVLNIDYCSDLPRCLALAPEDVVIMGNISPILLWEGSLDEVRAQTEQILAQTRNYKNFIFGTGCQVPGFAPRENVQLAIDMAKEAPLWSNEEYREIRRLSRIYCEKGPAAFAKACEKKPLRRSITSLDESAESAQACEDKPISRPLMEAAQDIALKYLALKK